MSWYVIFAELKWANIVFKSLMHASIATYSLKLKLNTCTAVFPSR